MRTFLRFRTAVLSIVSVALVVVACNVGPADIQVATDLVRQSLGQPLVLSQIFGGDSTGDGVYSNDWVELHNTSNQPVTLGGYSLQYASASGTSWIKVILPDAGVRAGGYFLVQIGKADGGNPVPADFSSSVFNMSPEKGKIALVGSTATLPVGACPNTTVVDFIGYGAANCAESQDGGTAPTMSAVKTLERRNNGCLDTDSNKDDFVLRGPLADGGMGFSPRNAASAALICNTAQADAGVVPCGDSGGTCTSTQCCDVITESCVEPNDQCFNGEVCSATKFICEPDAAHDPKVAVHQVGSRCDTDNECRAQMGPDATCKHLTSPAGTPYSNGYCTVLCGQTGLCPMGSTCVDASAYGEETMCWDHCGAGDACRPSYDCYSKDNMSSVTLGCWISPTPPKYDAGTPIDAGVTPVDAGSTPADAGMQPPVDAGTIPPVDAGIGTPTDAGTKPPVDAGIGTPTDAGTKPPVDAGIETPPDAGVNVPGTSTGKDAGLAVDAGQLPGDVGPSSPSSTDAGRRDAGTTSRTTSSPENQGCGCSSTETGLLLPFGLVAAVLRRRRSSERISRHEKRL